MGSEQSARKLILTIYATKNVPGMCGFRKKADKCQALFYTLQKKNQECFFAFPSTAQKHNNQYDLKKNLIITRTTNAKRFYFEFC